MYLKASKYPAVVVLDPSFSYPIGSFGRSLSMKLNQVGSVLLLGHVARLSKYAQVGVVVLLLLDGFASFFVSTLGCAFRFLGLRSFPISRAGKSFYDLALPCGGSLFEAINSPLETFVKVVILRLALCDHSQTKKNGETNARFKIVPHAGRAPCWYIPLWSPSTSEARPVSSSKSRYPLSKLFPPIMLISMP